MYLGKSKLSSLSNKKIYGKISTQEKMIGVYDTMGNILWSNYFIETQGYKVAKKYVTGKQECFSIRKKDKFSSSKHTKHINTIFFLMEIVAQGDI